MYCANVIGTVRSEKIIISILNVAEVTKEINESTINKILYEPSKNYGIHEIHTDNNNENRVNRILNLIRSDHMNVEEKQSIFEICEQYAEIFHLEGDRLTFTNAAEHVINLNHNQQLIYQRPYRLPHSQQAEIKNQLDKIEQDGIIEPSNSPWNTPLLLVKKKADASGKEKFRIVIDFRKLNQVTLNEFQPLPNITEILDHLGQCQLFSVIDLASGFFFRFP